MSNDSINTYMSTTSFKLPPNYDGYWVIGENFHIQIKKKPTEQQIKNTNELLGWEWKDDIHTK
jgi:hypothetical protein